MDKPCRVRSPQCPCRFRMGIGCKTPKSQCTELDIKVEFLSLFLTRGRPRTPTDQSCALVAHLCAVQVAVWSPYVSVPCFLQPHSGTREEPGTLTQGGALFSLVPLVWNRTQNSRAGARVRLESNPTTSPSGDLIPTIRGSGAHPGRDP